MSNEQSECARLKRYTLYYIIGIAFVEIRATDSMVDAKRFAGLFHNLPMRLLRCVTSDDYDAEILELLNRSKRYNMEAYMRDLILLAENDTSETTFEDDRPGPLGVD
jgi:hypothetical protein